jgi:hypothetical protein
MVRKRFFPRVALGLCGYILGRVLEHLLRLPQRIKRGHLRLQVEHASSQLPHCLLQWGFFCSDGREALAWIEDLADDVDGLESDYPNLKRFVVALRRADLDRLCGVNR